MIWHMWRWLIASLGVLGVALALLGLSACERGGISSGKPSVMVTIFAYYDAARAIAGPDAEVNILLPPGTSPHDFTPSPKDKIIINRANLIVKNGLGLDDWVIKLASDNTSAMVLSIGDGLEAIETHEEVLPGEAPNHEEPMGGRNPHVWLNPMNQIAAADMIREALDKLDPAHRSGYDERAAKYEGEIHRLDEEYKDATATFRYKEFIGFHSAYDYLARRYGLKQAAALQEIGEGGMSPERVRQVVELIKSRHIPVVFSETAFDAKQAQTVVKQTGVKLGTLQPLETYDNLNDTYVELMRENLAQLKKAMQ